MAARMLQQEEKRIQLGRKFNAGLTCQYTEPDYGDVILGESVT